MLIDEVKQLYKTDPPIPQSVEIIYQTIIDNIKESASYGANSYEIEFDKILTKDSISSRIYKWARQYIINCLEKDGFHVFYPMWNGVIVSGWVEE